MQSMLQTSREPKRPVMLGKELINRGGGLGGNFPSTSHKTLRQTCHMP